jgi:hypothetical protein
MAACRKNRLSLLALCMMILFAGIWADFSLADDVAIRSQQIEAPDAAAGDLFGFAMAADDRWLAVGAKFADTFCGEDGGAVYVYHKQADGQWAFVQKLVPLHGGVGDEFGESVAMRFDLLVVGARDADTQSSVDTGAAYIYRLNHSNRMWVPEQKLEPPSGKKKDQFGFALAINSFRRNCIAVSARRADSDAEPDTGITYTFTYDRRSGRWILDQTISPEDLLEDDEFGQSLAMDPFNGAWLAIGADQSSLAGYEDTGAVYIYDLGGRRPCDPGRYHCPSKWRDPKPSKCSETIAPLILSPNNKKK